MKYLSFITNNILMVQFTIDGITKRHTFETSKEVCPHT